MRQRKTRNTIPYFYPIAAALLLATQQASAYYPGAALLNHLDKQETFVCEMPVIGDQALTATIRSSGPYELDYNTPFQLEFDMQLEFDADASRVLREYFPAESLRARARLDAYMDNANQWPYTRALSAALYFPPTNAGEAGTNISISGTGITPTTSFDQNVGELDIDTGNMQLQLQPLAADGSPEQSFFPDPIPCRSTSRTESAFSVSPDLLDFGAVISGTSKQKQLTFTNRRDQYPMSLGNLYVEGPASIFFTPTSDCGNLQPGESCAVSVTYGPDGPGVHQARLVIGTGQEIRLVDLAGTSGLENITQPVTFPGELHFGALGLGRRQKEPVILYNPGPEAVHIDQTSIIDDTDTFKFRVTNKCPPTLEPEESCNLEVLANQADDKAVSEAMLEVSFVQPGPNTVTVPVSMEYEPPVCATLAPPLMWISELSGTTTLADTSIAMEANLAMPRECRAGLLEFIGTSSVFIPGWLSFLGEAGTEVELEFVPQGALQAPLRSFYRGDYAASAAYEIRVSSAHVNLFGVKLKLNVGPNCKTREPVTMDLSIGVIGGGFQVDGTYTIGDFENCGLATGLLNRALGDESNSLDLSGPIY